MLTKSYQGSSGAPITLNATDWRAEEERDLGASQKSGTLISQNEAHDPTRGPGDKIPPMYLKEGDRYVGAPDVISVKAHFTIRKSMFIPPFIHRSADHSA